MIRWKSRISTVSLLPLAPSWCLESHHARHISLDSVLLSPVLVFKWQMLLEREASLTSEIDQVFTSLTLNQENKHWSSAAYQTSCYVLPYNGSRSAWIHGLDDEQKGQIHQNAATRPLSTICPWGEKERMGTEQKVQRGKRWALWLFGIVDFPSSSICWTLSKVLNYLSRSISHLPLLLKLSVWTPTRSVRPETCN